MKRRLFQEKAGSSALSDDIMPSTTDKVDDVNSSNQTESEKSIIEDNKSMVRAAIPKVWEHPCDVKFTFI